MKRWLSHCAVACLIALPTSVFATTFTVTASGTSFGPNAITINIGDTIHWTCSGSHTVTSGVNGQPGAGSMFDQTMSTGQSFDFTFNSAGTFPYFCKFHGGLGMTATITVASTAVETTTWGKVKALFH